MQYLTIWDFILTPVYLIIIIGIATWQRNKRYPAGHPLRPYYLRGLYVKLGGAIFIALLYQYYYTGGDTYNFFTTAQTINSSLDRSFSTWLKLILRQSVAENPEVYPYAVQMYWYIDPSSYAVAVIAAIFGLFNGTSYIPIALLFAFFSYTGIWAMYRTFVNLYPKLYKELAIAFLFIPSTFVWGSAVFKDTICMFGLGWMTHTVFRLFINRDFSIKNIFLLILSFYLIATVKLYILMAFLPALSIWLLLTYSHKIKSAGARWAISLVFIGVAAGGFFFFTRRFAAKLDSYSLENIAQTAASTRAWIGYVSEVQEGAGYDLGEFEPTFFGMLTKFPQAVVVTLYRPFLWEVKKVIMLLSALEGLVFLYFTFKAFRRGIVRTFRRIFADPNLLFLFVYSIIFAFAVGISTYNFGTLSRYKIPCMPFFAALLLILYYQDKQSKKQINATARSRQLHHIA